MGKPKPGELYLGDCVRVMRDWPADTFDACVADPPYNISAGRSSGLSWAFSSHITMDEPWDRLSFEEYVRFSREWLTQVSRVVKPNGNIFIFASYHNLYIVGFVLNTMPLHVIQQIVWFKPNAQPNITCRMLTESCEYVIWACNETPESARGWTFNYEVAKQLNEGKQLRNMWAVPLTPKREKKFGAHPAQKPEAVVERLILIGTNPGDLILDPFAGSGTTGVVAKRTGRQFVLIEREDKYATIARQRLDSVSEPLPIDG